jgi:predicted TIM-barrel fold metal-dependent hydrolase
MPTDLAAHIQAMRVVDTHSHLGGDIYWEEQPRDVLADLFDHYALDDLVAAGTAPAAAARLIDSADPDVEGRFAGVAEAWRAVQLTGYGEAVRILAREIYGIEEVSPDAARAAQGRLDQLRQHDGRLHLLRDLAQLDHVQIDAKERVVFLNPSAPDFYLQDLSWADLCTGDVVGRWSPALAEATGIAVTDLASLRRAMEALFARQAPLAIAVKSQHAYRRTLAWQERSDAEAALALRTVLSDKPQDAEEPARLCLGDWCLARGVELAIEHNLPFKIHTGYYAGYSAFPFPGGHLRTGRIRAGLLSPLLLRYPEARFVLMHIAYPYSHELLALVKHFPNCYADLCWAWAIDPYTGVDFVRRFIHAAPITKLFAFGSDTVSPTSAYAYALQMRRWLTRALEAEVADGLLTEQQAIWVATRVLRENQLDCFDVAGTQAAVRQIVADLAALAQWPYRYRHPRPQPPNAI